MKLFLLITCIGFATAAQLTNTYLPPNNAISAGGSGSFLSAPFPSSGSGGHNNFGQSAYSFNQQKPQQQQQYQQQQQQYRPQQPQQLYNAPSTQYGSSNSASYRPSSPQIPILKYENINNGDGNYRFDYATGNGIQHQEQGQLKNAGGEYASSVVTGSYSYPGDDGKTYTVHYKADENGFQPIGDHLPTPPPIPEAIQKSLAYNAAAQNRYPQQQQQQHYQQSSGSYGGHTQAGFSQGGFSGSSAGYNSQSTPQKQYLPPVNRPSFSPSTGYNY